MAKIPEESSNPISNGISFFNQSIEEMKKVHYPTRTETIQASVGVLFLLVMIALFLGLTDLGVGWLMGRILT